jgi:hypothetical protein
MLERFYEYLNNEFIEVDSASGKSYRLKNIPNSFRELFSKMVSKNGLKWEVETLSFINISAGFTEQQELVIKERVESIEQSYKGPLKVEKIPEWYYKLLKRHNSFSLVRSQIVFGQISDNNLIELKPKCLDGLFYIGQYNGVLTVPIFTNTDGNIFAFSASEFRSYDDLVPNKKNLSKYREKYVSLIGYWDNIDDFLLCETKRLMCSYLAGPVYMKALKDIEPNNVSLELLEKLYREGKIKKS